MHPTQVMLTFVQIKYWSPMNWIPPPPPALIEVLSYYHSNLWGVYWPLRESPRGTPFYDLNHTLLCTTPYIVQSLGDDCLHNGMGCGLTPMCKTTMHPPGRDIINCCISVKQATIFCITWVTGYFCIDNVYVGVPNEIFLQAWILPNKSWVYMAIILECARVCTLASYI